MADDDAPDRFGPEVERRIQRASVAQRHRAEQRQDLVRGTPCRDATHLVVDGNERLGAVDHADLAEAMDGRAELADFTGREAGVGDGAERRLDRHETVGVGIGQPATSRPA
jgi:hypothetical protein